MPTAMRSWIVTRIGNACLTLMDFPPEYGVTVTPAFAAVEMTLPKMPPFSSLFIEIVLNVMFSFTFSRLLVVTVNVVIPCPRTSFLRVVLMLPPLA